MGIKERVFKKYMEWLSQLEDSTPPLGTRHAKMIDLVLAEIIETIGSMRTDNPYPTDIFTGKTEEGKIGQFGRKVWDDCLNELEKRLSE